MASWYFNALLHMFSIHTSLPANPVNDFFFSFFRCRLILPWLKKKGGGEETEGDKEVISTFMNTLLSTFLQFSSRAKWSRSQACKSSSTKKSNRMQSKAVQHRENQWGKRIVNAVEHIEKQWNTNKSSRTQGKKVGH